MISALNAGFILVIMMEIWLNY